MKKLRFYRDPDTRWYVDLPDWTGEKPALEMVAGADTMLEYMAEGETEVMIWLNTTPFEGAEKLEFISLADDIGEGAYYKMHEYKGITLGLKIWLCAVTLFVLKEYPQAIYICAIND